MRSLAIVFLIASIAPLVGCESDDLTPAECRAAHPEACCCDHDIAYELVCSGGSLSCTGGALYEGDDCKGPKCNFLPADAGFDTRTARDTRTDEGLDATDSAKDAGSTDAAADSSLDAGDDGSGD